MSYLQLHGDPDSGHGCAAQFTHSGACVPEVFFRSKEEMGLSVYAETCRLQRVRRQQMTTHKAVVLGVCLLPPLAVEFCRSDYPGPIAR